MFSKCPSLTADYKDLSKTLAMKYMPIEVDPTMPLEEKIKYMEEWWTLSEAALK